MGAKDIDLVWLRFLLHKFLFVYWQCKVRIEYRRYFWYLVGSFFKNQFYLGNKDFRAVMSRYLWNLKIKLFAFTYFISCIKLTLASLFWQVSNEQKGFSKSLLHAKSCKFQVMEYLIWHTFILKMSSLHVLKKIPE